VTIKQREHGTRACYEHGPGPGRGTGCRCPRCSAAHYAYKVGREIAIVRGEWAPWADAAPVREHVQHLVDAGLTEKNVADLAQVAYSSVLYLMHGTRGRPPGRRIRRDAAASLRAVRPPSVAIPLSGLVDATGTRRRVQALITLGWPLAWLADEAGWKRSNFWGRLCGQREQPYVTAVTAAMVRELYDRLWNTPPPQATGRERAACGRARALTWPPTGRNCPVGVTAATVQLRGWA